MQLKYDNCCYRHTNFAAYVINFPCCNVTNLMLLFLSYSIQSAILERCATMALILISTKKGTSYNRATDTEYVYENSTYYNDETGKKEYKRKLVGKIDRKTGEEISTGSVGRPRADRPTYGAEPEQ